MKTRRFRLGVIIVMAVVIICGLFFLVKPVNVDQPKAVNGVLDLRQYDINERGPVKLDGEWEFVSGKLLDSNTFNSQSSHIVEVPSLWTNYSLNGEKVSKYTSGTYRLKILLNHPHKILGIKTSNIRMSNAIYINGGLIGQSGTPSEKKSYVQHNIPYVAYFSPDNRELDLIVHVANFDYASGGGIIGSIFLGDQAGIGKLRERSLAYDWVTIIAFSTMFIYFLGTYIHARIRIEQLYFSLFCFANIFYSISHGEKVFLSIFPQTHW